MKIIPSPKLCSLRAQPAWSSYYFFSFFEGRSLHFEKSLLESHGVGVLRALIQVPLVKD